MKIIKKKNSIIFSFEIWNNIAAIRVNHSSEIERLSVTKMRCARVGLKLTKELLYGRTRRESKHRKRMRIRIKHTRLTHTYATMHNQALSMSSANFEFRYSPILRALRAHTSSVCLQLDSFEH